MAYQNTGYARNKTLTVTKGDYTKSYNLCDAFSSPSGRGYDAITDEQFSRLPAGEYERRRTDFIERVYLEEDGLENDCPDLAYGSVVYDPEHCPLIGSGTAVGSESNTDN